MFIALEGIDGTGKTTVAEKLREKLEAAGAGCVQTRTPGGDPKAGPEFRKLLLNPEYNVVDEAYPFLFLSDHLQTVYSVVLPSLAANNIVITDRYIASTWVYQVDTVDFLSPEQKDTLEKVMFYWMPTPDLTVILDATVDTVKERLNKTDLEFDGKDNFESSKDYEWARRRMSYLTYKDSKVAGQGAVITVSTESMTPDEIVDYLMCKHIML